MLTPSRSRADRGARLGRRFRVFQSSVMSSDLADGVYKIAIPLLALRYSDPAAAVSLVGVAVRLPWLLTTMPAGVLADRIDPRTVMRFAAALRLPFVLLLCLLAMTDRLPLWALTVAAFVIGTLGNVYDVGAQSLLPRLIQPDQLTHANANLQSAQMFLGQLLGPAVGGWAAGIGAGGGLTTAATLYLLAACSLGLLPSGLPAQDDDAARARRPRASIRSLSAELFQGLGYLRHRPDLARLSATAAANNLGYAMCLTVLPLWAVAPGRLQLSSSGYGLLLTALAIGSIGAGLAATHILRWLRDREPYLLRFGGPLLGLCFISIAVPSVPVVTAGLCCYGVLSMLWNVIVVTYRQATIPQALFGRVNAAYRWVTWGAFPLGALLAGALTGLVRGPTVFLVAGTIPLLTAAVMRLRGSPAFDAQPSRDL